MNDALTTFNNRIEYVYCQINGPIKDKQSNIMITMIVTTKSTFMLFDFLFFFLFSIQSSQNYLLINKNQMPSAQFSALLPFKN